jgi:hypothetical protein
MYKLTQNRRRRPRGGVEVQIYNVGGGWGGLTPRPGCFGPRKETRFPLNRRLGGPQCWSGRVRKISHPGPGIGILSPDRLARRESLYPLLCRSHNLAANFVVDSNVHGDKWQSPLWREKIAQTCAKLQRFIYVRCLHGFCRCRRV